MQAPPSFASVVQTGFPSEQSKLDQASKRKQDEETAKINAERDAKIAEEKAKPTTGAAARPHYFTYVGDDGQPHPGYSIAGEGVFDAEGNKQPEGTKVFSAWMQPRETVSNGVKEVPQPDGSIKLVPVTTSSTTTRGGIAPPPSKDTPTAPSKSTAPAPKTAGAAGKGQTVGGRVPTEVKKAYDSYNAAQERYAVMQDALARAQNGDQQAMVNLLANHIGMTMGLQKGSRITQAIYNEAMESAPWLQRVEARFDKDGYLSGVVLTPTQMKQMIDLAKVRLDQDKQSWQREVEANKTGYGTMSPPPKSGDAGDPLGLFH
jgi:hypothetical protein